ncbi:Nucleoporin nup57 [Linderina macrospora]|uniref:Nucleoporin nup57 n=1 Tax=Linderina macrospora TaxID=4868 RepID=A0ACC1J6N1_9FUNG|nr:Nucleoporin nup57 [Linderina macrospora]
MQAQQQQQQQLLAQQQQQQQQQQKPSEADELSQHFMMIKECWDPNSPNFQFRHYFYNVCEPGQAHLYQCPPNTDPRLWEQAQQDNPDPSSLVPVVASGFDDLRKRVDSQSLQQQSYQERVTEISDKLRTILQKHHSGTSVRLADCRRRQADLGQRLLEFMKWLQVLRQADAPLTADEVILKERIDNLERELSKAGSVKQRLAELQDNTYRLQASARRRREMLGMAGNGSAGDNYEVADQSQLESVLHMLAEKQRGLTQLTQVVAQDKDALEEIERVNAARAEEVVKQQELHDSVRMARPQYAPW